MQENKDTPKQGQDLVEIEVENIPEEESQEYRDSFPLKICHSPSDCL